MLEIIVLLKLSPHALVLLSLLPVVKVKLFSLYCRERYSQLVTFLYDKGLNRLRHVFKTFYPNWNNSPADAKGFQKGQLQFRFPDQEALFDAGDINHWDFTLITNILLHSKVSGKHLKSSDPKYNGFQGAIIGLQTIRNEFAHAPKPSLTEADYDQILDDAIAHLMVLGADKKEFDDFIKGELYGISVGFCNNVEG